jgi:hypothetical protein
VSDAPTRDFGPFELAWTASGGPQPSVHVELTVVGELLWAVDLRPTSASRAFQVALNAYTAAGTLTVGWLDPGATHGQLVGEDCLFAAPGQRLGFSGTIGVW